MINNTVSQIPILIIKPHTTGSISSCIEGLDCPVLDTIKELSTNYGDWFLISLIVLLGFLMFLNFQGGKKCIIKS